LNSKQFKYKLFNNKKLYQSLTRLLTEFNYRRYIKIIDPGKIRSKEYHLDHILSVRGGYSDAIDPIILAHPANLRMIPAKVNMAKGRKCHVYLKELKKNITTWETTHGPVTYDTLELLYFFTTYKPYHR